MQSHQARQPAFRSDDGRVVLEFRLDLSQAGRDRLEPRTGAKVAVGPPSGLNPTGRSSCTAASSASLRSSMIGHQHGRRSASPLIRGAHTLRVFVAEGLALRPEGSGKRALHLHPVPVSYADQTTPHTRCFPGIGQQVYNAHCFGGPRRNPAEGNSWVCSADLRPTSSTAKGCIPMLATCWSRRRTGW